MRKVYFELKNIDKNNINLAFLKAHIDIAVINGCEEMGIEINRLQGKIEKLVFYKELSEKEILENQVFELTNKLKYLKNKQNESRN